MMLEMFFSDFLFILRYILLDLLSLGSAKTYIRRSGKLDSNLMANFVRNICTKNYPNMVIDFQVTVQNVGDAFLGR